MYGHFQIQIIASKTREKKRKRRGAMLHLKKKTGRTIVSNVSAKIQLGKGRGYKGGKKYFI